MVYKNQYDFDDDTDYLQREVSCEYIFFNELSKIRNKNHLTLLSHNIRSMYTNFDNLKAEAFGCGMRLDVLGLCETHLTDDTENLYKLNGYNFYSTNISSNKGGVCMFIINTIPCKLRSDLTIRTEYLETVFVECTVNNDKLVIGMIYHRPGSSFDSFTDNFQNLLESINCNCIVMGDFNINILNEQHDNNASQFVTMLREHFYHPMITKPTRVHNRSATLLDHIWVNFDHNNTNCSNIVFSGITDHFPVIYHHRTHSVVQEYKEINYRQSGEQCDLNFKRELENHDWNQLHNIAEVNQSFDYFNNTLIKMYDESYPLNTKRVKINSIKNPWITQGIKGSIKINKAANQRFDSCEPAIKVEDLYRYTKNNTDPP